MPGNDSYKYFQLKEFACKCGCGLNAIDPALVKKLDQGRAALGRPIVVSSGCRCPAWNAHEGGSLDSAHLKTQDELCHAADIRCLDSRTRFQLYDIFRSLGFVRIGIAKTFIHIDNSPYNAKDVLWPY